MAINRKHANNSSQTKDHELHWILRAVKQFKLQFNRRRANTMKETVQDRAARRTSVATVVIAFFTAATVIVGSLTYCSIDGQLTVMREQLNQMVASGEQTNRLIVANEKLSSAAANQASAAANSAKIAEEALRLTKTQLRAYVALVPPTVFNVVAQGSPVVIYAQFTNNGQTPARAVERSVGISMHPPSKDFREAITEPGALDINAGRITPVVERSIPKSLTVEEVASVKERKSKIYVFGTVKFKDALGDRYEDSFCFEYSGSGLDFVPQGFGYPGFMARPCAN